MLLGYQYYISQVKAVKSITMINLTIAIENKGNAPFLYDLNLDVVSDKTNSIVYSIEIDSNLLSNDLILYNILLSENQAFDFNQVFFKLSSSSVNQPILFANKEVNDEGQLKLIPDKITENTTLEFFGTVILITISTYVIFILREKREKFAFI